MASARKLPSIRASQEVGIGMALGFVGAHLSFLFFLPGSRRGAVPLGTLHQLGRIRGGGEGRRDGRGRGRAVATLPPRGYRRRQRRSFGWAFMSSLAGFGCSPPVGRPHWFVPAPAKN